jgi:hypothetical protein
MVITEIEKIIDELVELEWYKVAAVTIMSSAGKIIHQVGANWDLTNDSKTILDALKDTNSLNLMGVEFTVVHKTPEAIIGTDNTGKGHVVLTPFKGGILVCYIMPKVDPRNSLSNIQNAAFKLNGKV